MAEGLGSVGDPVEEELELDMSLSDVIQMMQKVETEYKGGTGIQIQPAAEYGYRSLRS